MLTNSPSINLFFYIYDFNTVAINFGPKTQVIITFGLNRYHHLCTWNVYVFKILSIELSVQDWKLLLKNCLLQPLKYM